MLTDKQKTDFASLRVEILDLNVVAYFFIKKINRFAYLFQKTTREYVLEEFIALRYMENGIILHLTNLDDDSSKYSFQKVTKDINKTIKDPKLLKTFNQNIKDYRKNINTLKVKHRNTRIAHLNYDDDLNFDQFLNFATQLRPLILEANKLADLIWGEKINVHFKLGSLEGILDFRKGTENFTIDVTKVKSFI